MELHHEHSEPPDSGGESGDDASMVWWAPLPDFNPEDDEEGRNGEYHLLKCCGISRPRAKAVRLVVQPDPTSGRNFVSIHDYVSAVHPWLMSRRQDILSAKAVVSGDGDDPLPEDAKLVVECFDLDSIVITEEAEWVKDRTWKMWTPPLPAPDDGRGDYLYSRRLNEHIPTGDIV